MSARLSFLPGCVQCVCQDDGPCLRRKKREERHGPRRASFTSFPPKPQFVTARGRTIALISPYAILKPHPIRGCRLGWLRLSSIMIDDIRSRTRVSHCCIHFGRCCVRSCRRLRSCGDCGFGQASETLERSGCSYASTRCSMVFNVARRSKIVPVAFVFYPSFLLSHYCSLQDRIRPLSSSNC
ncbi:hypothetical protein B0T09DRAFT_331221 [Sordaria sp. MPI-SDFR-AT-0083]|nr:hypothetical protein B0T09DRAFT_331221 [Sordaria sp. MPI-SDFR-AT-0083]